MMRTEEKRDVAIVEESDVVRARGEGRKLAEMLGFSLLDCTQIATAISELARNILLYVGTGHVELSIIVNDAGARGIEIVAIDNGPGIADLNLVMRDGYTTSGGLGLGLPGTRRLMDEFELKSTIGEGTTVRTIKWL